MITLTFGFLGAKFQYWGLTFNFGEAKYEMFRPKHSNIKLLTINIFACDCHIKKKNY